MAWPAVSVNVALPGSFKVETDEFVNHHGQKICCKSWMPLTSLSRCRGLVFMIHGYMEHSGVPYYDTLATMLVGLGCYVFIQDLVGHGMSEGGRANVKTFDDYLDDILFHVDKTRRKFSRKAVYLIGHSMGGTLALMAAQKRVHDFAGIIIVSPLIAPSKELAPWYKRTTTKILGRLVPGMPVAALDLTLLTRDANVVSWQRNDPLRYKGHIPVGWAAAGVVALENLHKKAHLVQAPLLVQVGAADKICAPAATEEFFQTVHSSDKTFKVYPGAYHNILAEIEGVPEKAFQDIADWMAARLPPESATPSLDLSQSSKQ
ncbi:monoglyceride lipase-like [Amblyomma americanum]